MTIALIVFATLLVGIPYASIFEWTLHRHVMHRPVGNFRYAYNAHALTHHRLFGADQTYHLHPNNVLHKIPMAWWNGPVLIFVSGLPFFLAAVPVYFFLDGYSAITIILTALILLGSYYGIYEYIHWCWHLPRNRKIERLRIFQYLNGLHIVHHRHMGYNFNLVVPFADWLFGTYLPRAKKPFVQVRGSGVPDVQPFTA